MLFGNSLESAIVDWLLFRCFSINNSIIYRIGILTGILQRCQAVETPFFELGDNGTPLHIATEK
jgi:hypothetical protein